MGTTFYLGGTNADLSGGASFSKYLEEETESAGSITISRGDNSTFESDYGFTREDIPDNPNWNVGVITVKINVTNVSRNVVMKLSASRINSDGVVQETTDETGEQTLSSIQEYTFTIPTHNWDEGDESDRLRINYISRGTHAVQGGTVTIETGTSSASVETPIEISPFDSPVIVTNQAENITRDYADLNGYLDDLGEVTEVDVFFQYRKIGGSWSDTTKNTRTTTGSFSQGISNLDHSSTYEVRAVGEYDRNGTTEYAYGNTLEFDTKEVYSSAVSMESYSELSVSGRKVGRREIDIISTSETSAELYIQFFVEIERRIGEGEWELIAKIYEEDKGSPETFTDDITEFEQEQYYHYRARRYQDGAYMEYSNVVSIYFEEVTEYLTGEAPLQSTSLLSATGRKLQTTEAEFETVSSLEVEGQKAGQKEVELETVSETTSTGIAVSRKNVELQADSDLIVTGQKLTKYQPQLTSISSITATGQLTGQVEIELTSSSAFNAVGKAIKKGQFDIHGVSETISTGDKTAKGVTAVTATSETKVLDLPVITKQVHLRPYAEVSAAGRKKATGQLNITSNSELIALDRITPRQAIILTSTSKLTAEGKKVAKDTVNLTSIAETDAFGAKTAEGITNITAEAKFILDDNIIVYVVVTTEEPVMVGQTTAEVATTVSIPEGWWG